MNRLRAEPTMQRKGISQTGENCENDSRCEPKHLLFVSTWQSTSHSFPPSAFLSQAKALLHEPRSNSGITNVWYMFTDMGWIKPCLQTRTHIRIQWISAQLFTQSLEDLLKTLMPRSYHRLTVPVSWAGGTQASVKSPPPPGHSNVQLELRSIGLKLSTVKLPEGAGDFCSRESEGKVWTKIIWRQHICNCLPGCPLCEIESRVLEKRNYCSYSLLAHLLQILIPTWNKRYILWMW